MTEESPNNSMRDESQDVDLIQQARLAQQRQEQRYEGSLKLIAPAKVNLFLGIGQRRSDGYHEALSIMHALSLHDVVYMKTAPAQEGEGLSVEVICVACEGTAPVDVPSEENLACKAVRKLARLTGHKADEHMTITIEKHIPAQAGLGGGSSDAAAALVGAAQLWGLDRDDARVTTAARELGADVAFFLQGGCACLEGVGDVLDHTLEPMGTPVVLIKPEGGVSTAAAYKGYDECPDSIDAADFAAARDAKRAQDVPWRNNLVCAAEALLPVLKEVREWIVAQDSVSQALMSGSGSAVFAVCDNLTQASKLAAAARAQGWWARTTTFSPIGAVLQLNNR